MIKKLVIQLAIEETLVYKFGKLLHTTNFTIMINISVIQQNPRHDPKALL